MSLRGLLQKPLHSTTNSRARLFHSTPHRAVIKAGDALPSIGAVLMENSPANKVDLAAEVGEQGRALVVGVPAAFSPSCSESHIPGYIKRAHLLPPKTFVLSVNDPFVMKAWAASLNAPAKMRFLADPAGTYTQALEMGFDKAKAVFGPAPRSRRFALLVKDGKVESVHVEEDDTGLTVSVAEKVLG